MKYLDKWRETIDPFTLPFNSFKLKEVMGYPHAGNDVFYVRGIHYGKEVTAYIKAARQKGADICREIEAVEKLKLELCRQFGNNKEQYIAHKTEFVQKYTAIAKQLYKNRYE